MPILTRTFAPEDYDALPKIDGKLLEGQGPQRRWEYGMAFSAIDAYQSACRDHGEVVVNLCLDVGGAGSPFAKLARNAFGLDVRVIDPRETFPLEKCIAQAPYVMCISTIEHVPDLYDFCAHLIRVTAPGGLLFITTDIWNRHPSAPDRAHFHWMRKRIFTPESWQHLAAWFTEAGFSLLGDADWTYRGDQQNHGYSFCTLAMTRAAYPKAIPPFNGEGAMMHEQAIVRQRYNCRVCGEKLEHALNLGTMYISDFVEAPETSKHPPVPLILTRCPRCTLVQLRDTVPREWLYSEQYWYKSGINESMVAALRNVVKSALQYVSYENMTVIDIGANDGTLLRQYAKELAGIKRSFTSIGVDPAANLHNQLARSCDIMIPDYWPLRAGYQGHKAHIITACAMFYDLEDPGEFVKAVKEALAPGGVFIIQLGDLDSMLTQTAFDTICHEHLEYYSLTSLKYLLEMHGLTIFDVTKNQVNGGSLRVFAKHAECKFPVNTRVEAVLLSERVREINTLDALKQFSDDVYLNRKRVLDELKTAKVVDVYGASTKGNTLLQYYQVPNIRRAIERSPEKAGKYTVGTWIPIVGEEEGRRDPADLWLVPIWHFKNAIIPREQEFLKKGRMLFPLPNVMVVGPNGERDEEDS